MCTIYRFFLPFVLVLSMTGCGTSEPPLRIGTNVWPGYEPLYLARERGYLDRDRVQLVELLSASEVIRAYRNGALDVAALTLDEVLLLRDSGVDAQVLLITDSSYGADAILAREGETVADLKGRRVGVETSALGAYVLSRALSLGGLSAGDLEIVPLEVNHHEEEFLGGRVDAVVTFEPIRSRLLAAGAQEIFNSQAIPDEVIDLLVVRSEVAEKRPEQLAYLLDAWFDGVEYLKRDPEQAHKLMSARLGIAPEQVEDALAGLRIPERSRSREMIYAEPSALIQQALRLQEVMYARDLLAGQDDLSRFLVSSEVWE